MNKILSGVRSLAVLSALTASVACADDAECSEGQTLTDGACVPSGAAGTGASSATGGSAGMGGSGGIAGSAGIAGSSGSSSGGSAGACTDFDFGQACSDSQTHSDCGCAADYCAVQPGHTSGFCTATGCKEDPSVCKAGWTCLDLSAFDPTLPSICREP